MVRHWMRALDTSTVKSSEIWKSNTVKGYTVKLSPEKLTIGEEKSEKKRQQWGWNKHNVVYDTVKKC